MERSVEDCIRTKARAIREFLIANNGSIEGSCKEVSVALALSLSEIHVPILVCAGTIEINGEPHEHHWCRVQGAIVDATADQFRESAEVVIKPEAEMANYREESFMVLYPAEILELMRAADSRTDRM